MTINYQIRDEKLQYDINREAAEISAVSSGKIHKYEYHTGDDLLPSNQQQIIEQARFTYFPLGKAFEKQIKTIEDQGEKQVDALYTLKSNNQLTVKDAIPKNVLNNDEAKKSLIELKKQKKMWSEKPVYETKEYTYSFKNFQTIKAFGRNIYEGKITIKEADEYQKDLLVKIMSFRKIRNQGVIKKKKKKLILKTCIIFLRGEKKFLTLLKAKYFKQNLRVQAF